MRQADVDVLDGVLRIVRTPLDEVLPALSTVLAPHVPHEAVVMLTGDCSRSPLVTAGQVDVTAEEMAALAERVAASGPWSGTATLGGRTRPTVAAMAAPDRSAGSLLAVLRSRSDRLTPDALQLISGLWEVAAQHVADLLPIAEPVHLAPSRAAASERAQVAAQLNEEHATTLTTVLGVLRSRALDDTTARRTARELAVTALLDLRSADDPARGGVDESAGAAFRTLGDKLTLLARYREIELELIGPDHPDRPLPHVIAHAGRATVRGAVLAMLDGGGVGRIRVEWRAGDDELRVTVRDDGPGIADRTDLDAHRIGDRLAGLGGGAVLEAVPGWGTTVTARIPLAPAAVPPADPLLTLNPRELDVLAHLVRGRRNSTIAEHLHISVNTVKFHVANILAKLEVGSRGEAAALARTAGWTG